MFKFSHIALASALMVAGVSSADAGWKRTGSGTGPYGGQWSSSGSGSCAGGVCTSTGRVTGPAGNTFVRNSTGSCSGGTCSRSTTVTGPNGTSATRSGTFTRN
jgi:hypothetical protein